MKTYAFILISILMLFFIESLNRFGMNGISFMFIFLAWLLSSLYLRTIDSGWWWILGPIGLVIEFIKKTIWCIKGKSLKYYNDDN